MKHRVVRKITVLLDYEYLILAEPITLRNYSFKITLLDLEIFKSPSKKHYALSYTV